MLTKTDTNIISINEDIIKGLRNIKANFKIFMNKFNSTPHLSTQYNVENETRKISTEIYENLGILCELIKT